MKLGNAFRTGALDKNGKEAVGGVVIARYGVNTLEVIEAVKQKIEALQVGFPQGVRLVPFYDRTQLIDRATGTLKRALIEELLLVTLAHIIFLAHFRSILIVTIPLPLAVLISFLFMYYMGISSNLMSLSGIAIAIGVLVDAGIVVTENAFRFLEQRKVDPKDRKAVWQIVLESTKLVGPTGFLFDGDHNSRFHSGLCSHRSGRQTVSSAGIHKNICDGRSNADRGHAGACALHISARWQGSL